MPTPDEANPYRSPNETSVLIEPAYAPPSGPRRRIRWRVIPVTLLYFFGAWAMIQGVLIYVLSLWLAVFGDDRVRRIQIPVHLLVPFALGAIVLIGGGLVFWAARNLWKGRWRRGIIALFAASLCGLLIVGLLFAAERLMH
jgi:hypothetical protein